MLLMVMNAIGIAALTLALTKAKVSLPFRELVAKANIPMLTYMVGCPFCMGFWLSMVWMIGTHSYLEVGLAVWGTQTLIVGLMMRALFMHEAEMDYMQNQIDALRAEADAAYNQGYYAGLNEPKEGGE